MGNVFIKIIDDFCKEHKLKKIVDYGSGQGLTTKKLLELGYDVIEYEPGIKEKRENFKIINSKNFQSDLLICTDVLEHIPEDELTDFLTDLFSYSSRLIITICTREARLLLPNGENPHCTVRPGSWWIEQLSQYTNTLIPVPELTIPVDGILGYKTF